MIGKKLGNYIVLEHLGSGGMSQVYKGEHLRLGRKVAIKVLDPQFLADMDFVKLFNLEARSLAGLSHPNIVQVYDYDIRDEFIYTVMEYIDGLPLSAMLNQVRHQKSVMPIATSVKVIKSIASALSYAHKKNVVHRDVKPSNILVENTGRVVLVDFGFAKTVTGLTTKETGTIRGTPAYMAPEHTQGYPARGSLDIYSLGVVFYELAINQLPFVDDNPIKQAIKHIRDVAPRPRSIVSGVSKKIENIILRAMAKNPLDRYRSMNEMLKDINKLKEAKTEKLPTATLGLAYANFPGKREQKEEYKIRVTLHIMETGQLLELPEGKSFTVGRVVAGSSSAPDIDLAEFKGYESGISREHAKILIDGKRFSVVDLGSSNGTWINGVRIQPNVPFHLDHGEIISFGKIKIQMLIYIDKE